MLNKHNFVLKYYDVLYGRLSTYQYPLVFMHQGRNHSVTPWCIQDFIFHYTYVFLKKKNWHLCNFELMRAL
jgi:hypothetical protein